MSEIIWGQVLFVLASLCNGMLLIAGYDVLRLLRWLIPHGKVWLWVEDTLYWCLAAIPTFYLFFSYNEGVIRWYGLLGILVGAVLYETGISLPIRNWLGKYADRIRRWLRKYIHGICRWLGMPLDKMKKKRIQKSMARKERRKEERRKEEKRREGRQREEKRNRGKQKKQEKRRQKKGQERKKRT